MQQTLSSLFDNLKEDRIINVKFVVFVAETDKEYLNKTISQISEQFPEQIKNNILQVKTVLFLFFGGFYCKKILKCVGS